MRHYLEISSADRLSGTSGDYRVSLQQSVKNAQSIRLDHCSFPYSWYNSGTVLVDEGGANQFTITLAAQNYTSANLASWLQTYMNANSVAGITYTVTYDSTQAKLTISGTGAFDLQFSGGTGDIFNVMGFSPADTGSAVSHTSNQVVILSNPQIYLEIQNFPTNITATNSSGVNFVLPVRTNFGGWNEINQQDSWFQQVELQHKGFDIRDILVKFKRQDGTVIDFQGGDNYIVFHVITYDE